MPSGGGKIAFAGGWARWGANDAALGVPFGEVGQNLTSIAEAIGAPRVLLCSIPPRSTTGPAPRGR